VTVTVLWEDQRAGGPVKGFGPHELLLTCVQEKTGRSREELKRSIRPVPKKGVGNVLNALRVDLPRLENSGPVVAVIDRDKVLNAWMAPERPYDCMSAIRKRIAEDARGGCDVVFLIRNMEDLIDACRFVLGQEPQRRKPGPLDRDSILAKAAWSPQLRRADILARCPSFGRLVDRIARVLPE
jgi:hypothetical protein